MKVPLHNPVFRAFMKAAQKAGIALEDIPTLYATEWQQLKAENERMNKALEKLTKLTDGKKQEGASKIGSPDSVISLNNLQQEILQRWKDSIQLAKQNPSNKEVNYKLTVRLF